MKFLSVPFLCACFFLLLNKYSCAQENNIEKDSIVVGEAVGDNLYREDQFYFGFTFNLMSDLPEGVDQSGFSGGLHLGFTRDMPINKKRNIAIGAGLGWSVNSYGLNLQISEDTKGGAVFKVLDDDVSYDTNRYTTYLLEAPIEFRWRTSTPDSHKFWRIYFGLRLGYLYHFKSRYEGEGIEIVQHDFDELNRFRLGATFTFGYNTFNFHLYYGLNSFFEGQTLESQQEVGISTFKIGLMFYIL